MQYQQEEYYDDGELSELEGDEEPQLKNLSKKPFKRNGEKTNWSTEEDDQLRELILVKRLSNWERIGEYLNKTPKECCKRYLVFPLFSENRYSPIRWNTLRPPHHFEVTERRKWVPSEDQQLIKLVEKYGTKNWRIIGTTIYGLTSNQQLLTCTDGYRSNAENVG